MTFWPKVTQLRVLMIVGVVIAGLATGVLSAQTAPAPPSSTQAGAGRLHGQVIDPTGAVIPNSAITLKNEAGQTFSAKSDGVGSFQVKDLPSGKYSMSVTEKGFAPYAQDVQITAGAEQKINITLEIQVKEENIDVGSEAATVNVNPDSNASSVVISGKDLDALSDDPDELQSELQALAGPSAGPNGGQIYIDGFTGGQLPPKASIREIRVNQNPFSAEYDKLGYGRIEIFTKPGTDKLHGQLYLSGNSSAFNARNPFEVPENGASLPSYHSTQFSGSLGGALSKKASFFFNLEHRDIEDLGIISATVLDPDFNIVPYSASVSNPQKRTNLSPRLDYQLTPNNSLSARYQYFRNTEENDNVGQFDLAEMAANDVGTEQTFQLTDTQIFGAHVVNETRFQYVRETSVTTPLTRAPTVNVGGAFTGNGACGGIVSDTQNRFELQNITYINRGK